MESNDCVDEDKYNLDTNYCKAWSNPTNINMTRLVDNKCGGWLIIHSSSQALLIVSLLGFIALIMADLSHSFSEGTAKAVEVV